MGRDRNGDVEVCITKCINGGAVEFERDVLKVDLEDIVLENTIMTGRIIQSYSAGD